MKNPKYHHTLLLTTHQYIEMQWQRSICLRYTAKGEREWKEKILYTTTQRTYESKILCERFVLINLSNETEREKNKSIKTKSTEEEEEMRERVIHLV